MANLSFYTVQIDMNLKNLLIELHLHDLWDLQLIGLTGILIGYSKFCLVCDSDVACSPYSTSSCKILRSISLRIEKQEPSWIFSTHCLLEGQRMVSLDQYVDWEHTLVSGVQVDSFLAFIVVKTSSWDGVPAWTHGWAKTCSIENLFDGSYWSIPIKRSFNSSLSTVTLLIISQYIWVLLVAISL